MLPKICYRYTLKYLADIANLVSITWLQSTYKIFVAYSSKSFCQNRWNAPHGADYCHLLRNNVEMVKTLKIWTNFMVRLSLISVGWRFLPTSIYNLQVVSWQLLQNKTSKLKAAAPNHEQNEAWRILGLFQKNLEGKFMNTELVFLDSLLGNVLRSRPIYFPKLPTRSLFPLIKIFTLISVQGQTCL